MILNASASIAIEKKLRARINRAMDALLSETLKGGKTMAISTPWIDTSTEQRNQCKLNAEHKAGPSEHGYLYRLYWSRKKNRINLIAYPILKITPKCWKIHPKIYAKPIYVSQNNPRYAHDDLKDALDSYRIRRQSCVTHAEFRLREAQQSLAALDVGNPINELFWLQDEFAPVKDDVREDEEELV
jgi:hypothetical protein